jgi:hypothetical protein
MRIAKDQLIAGYPALTVRTFLRRSRSFTIVPATAAYDLKISEREAVDFLLQLASLGFIASEHPPVGEPAAYEITTQGNAFANASAAKPVLRKTADLALEQFMERLGNLNASPDYVYRVKSAVLFGSMLAEVERLGDVDIAIELEAKIAGQAEFRSWCEARRQAAAERGVSIGSMVDWVLWPRTEIFRVLRARARTLSLHEWNQVTRMKGLRYRVLWGTPKRISRLIPNGRQD